jgi:PadR family transcriptional regulator PadR
VVDAEGPHRKYHGITPVGRAELKRQGDDWQLFSEAVGRLLDTTTGSTR